MVPVCCHCVGQWTAALHLLVLSIWLLLRLHQLFTSVAGQAVEIFTDEVLKLVPGASIVAPLVKSILSNALNLSTDEEELTSRKLDELASKVDALGRKIDDATQLSTLTTALNKDVETTRSQIIAWSIQLRRHRKNNDIGEMNDLLTTLLSASNGIGNMLGNMHVSLVVNNGPHLETVGGRTIILPILAQLREVLQELAMAEARAPNYDVVALNTDLIKWNDFIVGIMAKGTALAITAEKWRLLKKRNDKTVSAADQHAFEMTIARNVADLQRDFGNRRLKYSHELFSVVIGYPFAQFLLRQASVSLENECPAPVLLRLEGTEKYLWISPVTRSEGMYKLLDTEVLGHRTWNKFFAFARVNGRWTLRGSRYEANPDVPKKSLLCRNSGNDTWGLSNNADLAELCVIPRPAGSHNIAPFTLLILDKDRQKVVKRWEVIVEHSDGRLLNHISFVPGNSASAFSLIPSPDHKRILFWVNNLRSDNCVLVLQAVRSSNFSSFVCPGMVWLKGQRQCFIVWRTPLADDDIKLIAIFRLYNLDAQIDATQQSSVEPLLHQDPVSGRLALRGDRAQAVADIYLTIFNPIGMKHNWVSALALMPLEWDNARFGFRGEDVSDVSQDDKVEQRIEQSRAYQKESKEVSGLSKLKIHIGGSNNPDGSIDVETA